MPQRRWPGLCRTGNTVCSSWTRGTECSAIASGRCSPRGRPSPNTGVSGSASSWSACIPGALHRVEYPNGEGRHRWRTPASFFLAIVAYAAEPDDLTYAFTGAILRSY